MQEALTKSGKKGISPEAEKNRDAVKSKPLYREDKEQEEDTVGQKT